MTAGASRGVGARGTGAALRALAVAFVFLVPSTATATDPASICIVRTGDVEGFETGVLDAAVRLESRKSGVVVALIEVADVAACPVAPSAADPVVHVVLGGPVSVSVRGPDGTTWAPDFAAVPAVERAGELARCLVDRVSGTRTLRATPLLLREIELPPQPPAPAEPRRPSRWAPAGYVYAAGRYAYEAGAGLHAGRIEVAGGVSFLDERLAAGIRAGLQPGRPVADAALPWEVLAVPILAEARLGWRLGPVLVRPGIAAGVEVRRHVVSLPAHLRERSFTTVAPLADVEVECMVRAGRWLRISVAGNAEFHLLAQGWNRSGDAVYRVPYVTAGAVLRLGVVVPGRGGG